MLTRFAILPLFLALNFPTCKKTADRQQDGFGANDRHRVGHAERPGSCRRPPRLRLLRSSANRRIDQNAQVVIFGYHRFVNNVRRPDTEITPAAFEAQMKELKDKNITVIPMQDFLAWRRGEKSIPPQERHHHVR